MVIMLIRFIIYYDYYSNYMYYVNYVHYTYYTMVIIRIMVIMHIILIILLFQICIDLDLADHVWQNKSAAIAQEVDGLGPQFRQALRDGLTTSRLHMLPSQRRRRRAHPLGRGGWSWKMIEHNFHQNDDSLHWSSLCQWKAWRPISTMNTHLQRRFCFANNAYNS